MTLQSTTLADKIFVNSICCECHHLYDNIIQHLCSATAKRSPYFLVVYQLVYYVMLTCTDLRELPVNNHL